MEVVETKLLIMQESGRRKDPRTLAFLPPTRANCRRGLRRLATGSFMHLYDLGEFGSKKGAFVQNTAAKERLTCVRFKTAQRSSIVSMRRGLKTHKMGGWTTSKSDATP